MIFQNQIKSVALGILAYSVCAVPQLHAQTNTGSLAEIIARAEKGEAKAQTELGQMYFGGKGVPKDPSEAAIWYRKADQGFVAGESSLGAMFEKGRGIAMDLVEAYKWYVLAADQGDSDAINAL